MSSKPNRACHAGGQGSDEGGRGKTGWGEEASQWWGLERLMGLLFTKSNLTPQCLLIKMHF